MFERETRREKILEARNKELRLKEKTKGILGLGGAIGIGGGTGTAGGIGNAGGDGAGKAAASTDQKKEVKAGGEADGGDTTGEAEEEDPIVKAEREFFQIIKQVHYPKHSVLQKVNTKALNICC